VLPPSMSGVFSFSWGHAVAANVSSSSLRHFYLSSIHLCRCSSFWALTSLKRRLHSPLSPACLLQPRIPRICSASLWTTSSHYRPWQALRAPGF
jgi:hypothetical protein